MKTETVIKLMVDGFYIERHGDNYSVYQDATEEMKEHWDGEWKEHYRSAEEAVDAFLMSRDLIK